MANELELNEDGKFTDDSLRQLKDSPGTRFQVADVSKESLDPSSPVPPASLSIMVNFTGEKKRQSYMRRQRAIRPEKYLRQLRASHLHA